MSLFLVELRLKQFGNRAISMFGLLLVHSTNRLTVLVISEGREELSVEGEDGDNVKRQSKHEYSLVLQAKLILMRYAISPLTLQ